MKCSARRVVVDDPPAVGQLLEDQRVPPADRLLGQRQLPLAGDQGHAGGQLPDLHVGEGQLAHFLALGLVPLLVPVEGLLPAAGHVLAGHERQVLGVPVPGHEPGQVSLIPGGHLVVHDLLDVGRVVGRGGRGEGQQGEQGEARHGGTSLRYGSRTSFSSNGTTISRIGPGVRYSSFHPGPTRLAAFLNTSRVAGSSSPDASALTRSPAGDASSSTLFRNRAYSWLSTGTP